MYEDLIPIASRAIEEVAKREGVSVAEVRAAIRDAIVEAQKAPSPQAELLWRYLTHQGGFPTPEKLIAWAVTMIT